MDHIANCLSRLFSARRIQIVHTVIFFAMGIAVVNIVCIGLVTRSQLSDTSLFRSPAERSFLRDLESMRQRTTRRHGNGESFIETASNSGDSSGSSVATRGVGAAVNEATSGRSDSDVPVPVWEAYDASDDDANELETAGSAKETPRMESDGKDVLEQTDDLLRNLNSTGERDPELKQLFSGETNLTQEITKPCVKSLHLFMDMTHIRFVPELNDFKRILLASDWTDYRSDLDCRSSGYNCDLRITAGDDIGHLKGKDAVIFGMLSAPKKNGEVMERVIEKGPEPGQTWIYYSTEPPLRVVRWYKNLNITRLKYHALMTYNAESDIHIPFGYYRRFSKKERASRNATFLQEDFYNRTGLLSWVATNCNDVFWPRMPFVQRLKELMPLDDYGRCGTKECLPRRSAACNQLFASYKFFLAVPNSECDDYITEKFWMVSLKYGVVPLVLGARKRDYDRVAPPNSFVHFGSFQTVSDLADHLERVDKDDALYRKYHHWRTKGEVVLTYPLKADSLCRTLPHIRTRRPDEFKYIGDSPWFNGCRTTPNNDTIFNEDVDLENWSIWK